MHSGQQLEWDEPRVVVVFSSSKQEMTLYVSSQANLMTSIGNNRL